MIGIYKITNKTNGKVYIGQSNDIERRWSEHKRKYKTENTFLYQGMRLDGLENFEFSIEELCDIQELDAKEQYYINFYNSTIDGYNMNNVDRPQYTINNDIALQIINDLKNSTLNQNEIAEKFGVSHSLVSQINVGKMWIQMNVTYPIRDNSSSKIKVVNKCPICGKNIEYRSQYCIDCYKQSQRQHIFDTISRQELKNKIRVMPFTVIAKEFNTWDKTIKRWCKIYNLPSTKKEINSYSDKDWELV